MKTKEQEHLETTATQMVAAILSNSIYMDKLAKAGFETDDIEEGVVGLGYRVAQKIINKGKEIEENGID